MIIYITIMITLTVLVWVTFYRQSNHISLVSKEYDAHLNNLMNKKADFENNGLTIRFKGTDQDIWVGNYPYAYGNLFLESNLYPKMKTRKRLRNYIIRKIVFEKIKNQ